MMQGFYMLAMQQFRRRKRIALAACAAALIFTFFAARAWFTTVPAMDEQPIPASYTAVSEGGLLTVYRDGALLMRTEIDTRSLPQADRDALEKGVTLPDAEALAKLLEDYGS